MLPLEAKHRDFGSRLHLPFSQAIFDQLGLETEDSDE